LKKHQNEKGEKYLKIMKRSLFEGTGVEAREVLRKICLSAEG